MFEFLKKKIKQSIEDVKNVFTSKKEEPAAVPKLEPIKSDEEKIAEEAEKEVLQEELSELPAPDIGAETEAIEEPLAQEEKEAVIETSKELEEKLETKPEPKKKESIFTKITKVISGEKKRKKEPSVPAPEVKHAEGAPETKHAEVGFAEKISKAIFEKKLSETEFEKIFKDLEISLLEANIAFDVIQLLKANLKEKFVNHQVKRGKVEEVIMNTIEKTFSEILIEKDQRKLNMLLMKTKKKANQHHSFSLELMVSAKQLLLPKW